ncbi:MAG: PQQ-dependent sugar dehydrogenase [Thermoanaerobaculia bacterium]
MRLLLVLLSLVAATAASAAEPNVVLEPVVSGFALPVSITHAGDHRLFVTQQGGLVRIVEGARILPEPFLDLRSLVSTGGERGLLSIAFHPQYAQNGFFFVNYTDTRGDTVIARYRVSNDPNRADPNSRQILLMIDQPFANHNGGQLQFGPDGYLYIGMGDGGSGGDPNNHAQDPAELLGKMLRIDADTAPYSIPPSNPFLNQPNTRPEIWALGLRNPWRFSFDRLTGDLWIADVGQGLWEEIDFQPATSIGGENYGWRRMEGTHCFSPNTNCQTGTLILPVIEYDHSDGACSVTGGYVYRDSRNRRLTGMYIYGDFCNGKIWGSTRSASGAITTHDLFDATFLISTFGEDIEGELYVADWQGGVLYRIVDLNPIGPKRRAVR